MIAAALRLAAYRGCTLWVAGVFSGTLWLANAGRGGKCLKDCAERAGEGLGGAFEMAARRDVGRGLSTTRALI